MKAYLSLLILMSVLLNQATATATDVDDLNWSTKENGLIVAPTFQGKRFLLMSGLDNEKLNIGYDFEKDNIKKEINEKVNGICKMFGFSEAIKYRSVPRTEMTQVAQPIYYNHSNQWGAYTTVSEPAEDTIYGNWQPTKSYTTSVNDYAIDTHTTIFYVVVLDWILCN